MDIGLKIKRARENNGLTQDELANKLEISKSALWNYENNKRAIPVDVLIKCSNLLNVNFIAPALEKVTVINHEETKEITDNTQLDLDIEKKTNTLTSLNKDIEHLEKIKKDYQAIIETQEKIIKNQEELIQQNKEDNRKFQLENFDFANFFADKVTKYALKNNLINITNTDNNITVELKLLNPENLNISKILDEKED